MTVKTSGFIPVTKETMVDGLPFRTMDWPAEDVIVEYLRYGRWFTTGTRPFNPVDVAESVESVWWDDEDWLPYLDWPDDDWYYE